MIRFKGLLNNDAVSSPSSSHLDFIDLAKGLCIILVMSYHCDYGEFIYSNDKVNSFFFSFRMPLYFMLSGLFISFRHGYKDFALKKINRLIVPFFFFFFISSVICFFLKPEDCCSVFNFMYTEWGGGNLPIWFLLSLFTTYALYALITRYVSQNELILCVFATILGGIGFCLGMYRVNLPFFIDTSLTCFPFVVFGGLMRKHTNLLKKDVWYRCLLVSVVSFALCWCFCNGESHFKENQFDCGLVVMYLCGILGSVGIIYFAKLVNNLPAVNYIGRYSIIVLGIHKFLIIKPIFDRVLPSLDTRISIVVSVIVVIVASPFVIMFFRRLFPWFCAQKDLIGRR